MPLDNSAGSDEAVVDRDLWRSGLGLVDETLGHQDVVSTLVANHTTHARVD